VIVREHQAIRRKNNTRTAAAAELDAHDGRPNRFDGMNDGARVRIQ